MTPVLHLLQDNAPRVKAVPRVESKGFLIARGDNDTFYGDILNVHPGQRALHQGIANPLPAIAGFDERYRQSPLQETSSPDITAHTG